MEHYRGPHTRAEVRRALGKVAKLFVKRELQILVEQGVELVGGVVDILERQALFDYLQADVILLVYHNAQASVLAQKQRSA